METQNQENSTTELQIHIQYLKDLSFESPKSPSVFPQLASIEQHIDIQTSIDINRLQDDNLFEVILRFNISNKQKDTDQTIFHVEIAYAAIVMVKSEDKNHTQQVLYITVPSLLFPFVRELIANSIQQGGFQALYLQPINFAAIYAQKLEEVSKEQEQNPIT